MFVARLFPNLKAYRRRIIIATTGVRHGDDTGFQIRARHRDRPMKILGKGSDSATTRKVIAKECNALELTHCIVSMLPSVGAPWLGRRTWGHALHVAAAQP